MHVNYVSQSRWGLTGKVWLETVTYEASEKLKAGEECEIPVDTEGMDGRKGVHMWKSKSRKGQLAVVVNALYELPENLSETCKDHIRQNEVPVAGPVEGRLKIWLTVQSTGKCSKNKLNQLMRYQEILR